nr:endoglucanase 13-like [Ciona intestinalis]XP_026695442.1 endoglucanase 13-like [Ciona intestinalis]|eukprot:XP_026695441.1 endoglucanase 13-like [Ciona intestinalis]
MFGLLWLSLTVIALIGKCNAITDPVFYIEGNGWENNTHAGYIGHFKIRLTEEMPKWWIALVFPVPIPYFEAWQGTAFKQSFDMKIHYMKETRWNGHQYPGMVMDQRYMAEFPKERGVDYTEHHGPRPAIVFRHKVYIPSQTINEEHPMVVHDLADYRPNLPSYLELLPVLTITTPAPSTTSPRPTRGENSGMFWWVRTLSPPLTTTTQTTTTTTTTTAPTTTTPYRVEISCLDSVRIRRSRCIHQIIIPQDCYLPQCSASNPDRFNAAQCWQSKGFCWCVDPYNGMRTERRFVFIRNVRTLGCLAGLTSTASTTTTTVPNIAPTPQSPSAALPRPPFTPRNNYDYNLVIHNSLLFFEAQRSGDIGSNSRIRWRFPAHMTDGFDCGVDLSGGYYVSGDYVKYGFPTASAMTMLAWGYLEFPDAYDESGETRYLREALKWGTDYFIKAHVSSNKFVGQVGLSDLENSFWLRPQDMTVDRPCYNVTDRKPGSDLLAETAAAMAATAKVFMVSGNSSNDPYVQTLLQHARQLYDFAKTSRGTYSLSIRPAADHYPSNAYTDELVWAALWLYEATNERRFLADAGRFYDEFGLNEAKTEVSWDLKTTPVQLLLTKHAYRSGATSRAEDYLDKVTQFCEYSLNPEESIHTPQGLLYINQWGTTRYACNAAFVCLVASKLPALDQNLKRTYRKFAEDQIDYVLGKTGRSFVVGHGSNYPTQPHHRASSCSMAGMCGWTSYHSNSSNPQLLQGALVGGPDSTDQFTNDRSDYRSNGVSIDYNAGFQGAVAGIRGVFNQNYRTNHQFASLNSITFFLKDN